jgi:hypothetical protein
VFFSLHIGNARNDSGIISFLDERSLLVFPPLGSVQQLPLSDRRSSLSPIALMMAPHCTTVAFDVFAAAFVNLPFVGPACFDQAAVLHHVVQDVFFGSGLPPRQYLDSPSVRAARPLEGALVPVQVRDEHTSSLHEVEALAVLVATPEDQLLTLVDVLRSHADISVVGRLNPAITSQDPLPMSVATSAHEDTLPHTRVMHYRAPMATFLRLDVSAIEAPLRVGASVACLCHDGVVGAPMLDLHAHLRFSAEEDGVLVLGILSDFLLRWSFDTALRLQLHIHVDRLDFQFNAVVVDCVFAAGGWWWLGFFRPDDSRPHRHVMVP